MKSFYSIIHAVSPPMFGGETKNQDRIRFDSETNTACVCDGTTSSPYAELAAKIVSQSAPILLDNPEQNLKTVADYLMACRDRVIKKGIKADDSVPVSIRSIVQDAAKASLKQSFQTTLTAASFERQALMALMLISQCLMLSNGTADGKMRLGMILMTRLTIYCVGVCLLRHGTR